MRGMTYEQFDRVCRAERRREEEDEYAKRTHKVECTNFRAGWDIHQTESGRLDISGVSDGWVPHDEVVKRLPEGAVKDGILTCFYSEVSYLLEDMGGLLRVTADLAQCRLRSIIMEGGKVTQITQFAKHKGGLLWHFPAGMVQVNAISDYHGEHLSYCWAPREQVISDIAKLWGLEDTQHAHLYTSSGHRCAYELSPRIYRWSGPATVDLTHLGRVRWYKPRDGADLVCVTGLLSPPGMAGTPVPYYKLFLWPEWKKDQHVFVP